VTRLPASQRMALTVEEAAAQLGVSRSLAYELVRSGDLPHIRVGNLVRVPRLALERWIEERMAGRSA
jgi:excisionase family DNA binding protein